MRFSPREQGAIVGGKKKISLSPRKNKRTTYTGVRNDLWNAIIYRAQHQISLLYTVCEEKISTDSLMIFFTVSVHSDYNNELYHVFPLSM